MPILEGRADLVNPNGDKYVKEHVPSISTTTADTFLERNLVFKHTVGSWRLLSAQIMLLNVNRPPIHEDHRSYKLLRKGKERTTDTLFRHAC